LGPLPLRARALVADGRGAGVESEALPIDAPRPAKAGQTADRPPIRGPAGTWRTLGATKRGAQYTV